MQIAEQYNCSLVLGTLGEDRRGTYEVLSVDPACNSLQYKYVYGTGVSTHRGVLTGELELKQRIWENICGERNFDSPNIVIKGTDNKEIYRHVEGDQYERIS